MRVQVLQGLPLGPRGVRAGRFTRFRRDVYVLDRFRTGGMQVVSGAEGVGGLYVDFRSLL